LGNQALALVTVGLTDALLKRKKNQRKATIKKKRRRRRRPRRRRSLTPRGSISDEDNKPRGRKWKKMMKPRRRKRKKKKKQSSAAAASKKRPPLPLYASAAGKQIFPKNRHPIQIQFIEDFPASANLCVIFNSNTATHRFRGNGDAPFRTTGGRRRIHRASDCSCFEFSDQISNQKKHYNHCFSVEFQMGNVRYVTHFQEVNRVVLLWAKEIHGLYHDDDDDDDDDDHQTLINVPVLLCLPDYCSGGDCENQKEKMETMDLIICDAKSTAWLKHRHVQLFPVRQIKAADIQAYMNQAQRNNEDSQSSCSDADSLTRKKKKQQAQRNRGKKKKKRNRSRFWFRSRPIEKKTPQIPVASSTTGTDSPDESTAFKPTPVLDLATLRRMTRAVHPERKGLSSVETSPRGPFTLTHSNYSISSSTSSSVSSSSTSSLSQPSSPSGETVIESFSMTTATNTMSEYTSDGSSWFTDSQEEEEEQEEQEEIIEEEEEVESASYIQLPEDSTDRIISDSIETASSISETSSTSSWNHRHRNKKKRNGGGGGSKAKKLKKQKKKTVEKVKIPPINLPTTTTTSTERERLLQGIAQRMKAEVQKRENPQKTSPRFHPDLPILGKINVEKKTIDNSGGSSDNSEYNEVLSPRFVMSPEIWKRRKNMMMHVKEMKPKEIGDHKVKKKQRAYLVDLLDQKEAKELEKSPREKIKKFGRTLTRQLSPREKSTSLPPSLYASTNCLPIRAAKSKTTTKEL